MPQPPPPPRRGSRRSPPRDRTRDRVLAVTGVAALLLVFIVSVSMITGGEDDDASARQTAAEPAGTTEPDGTPTATATPTPKPDPTPVPLTADERAERDAAEAIVDSRGFEVTRLRDWDPQDTLRVLIGRTSTGSHLAFFFVNGDYIGNDSSEASAKLRVRRTADLTATLRYTTFEPGDEPTRPTGETVDVRFTWDGANLTPDAELPPPEARTPGQQPAA